MYKNEKRRLFFFLNMQVCDVPRRCLSTQIWMEEPYIKLLALTFFFRRRGGVTFILREVFLWKVVTLSQLIVVVDLLSVVIVFEFFQEIPNWSLCELNCCPNKLRRDQTFTVKILKS